MPIPAIQVDLKKIYKVVGVVLQGRQDKDAWVTEFKVSYSVDGLAWETAKVNKNEKVRAFSFTFKLGLN